MSTGSWLAGGPYLSSGPLYAAKTWNGANDPDKKKLNPYTMHHCKVVQTPTVYLNKYYPYVPPKYELYAYGRCPDTTKFPVMDNNAAISALNEVAEAIRGHNFSAGIFSAELGESVATVRNTALAFKKLIGACFSLNPLAIAQAFSGLPGNKDKKELNRAIRARDIGGVVLAMRYGWIPLLSDCWEAMLAIEAYMSSPTRVLAFSGKGKAKIPMDIRVSGGTQSVWVTYKQTVKYTVYLREKVSTLRTLGLQDPLSVIWEKVPFSFVWDWWMPVGSFLSACGFFNGLDVTYCRTTFSRVDEKWDAYGAGLWPPNTTYQWTQNGSYNVQLMHMTREVGTTLNIPLPSFKSMAKAFSSVHLQNAGALVLVLFSGQHVPQVQLKKPRSEKNRRIKFNWDTNLHSH